MSVAEYIDEDEEYYVEVPLKLPEVFRPLFTPSRYKAIHGGRGSGKSQSVARTLITKASLNYERILCAREYQNSINDSVYHLLEKLIKEMELYHQFEITQKTIIHKTTGSEFIFKGLRRDPHTIKGLEGISLVWCEEANVLSSESLELLIPTIREEGSEIWFTFNRKHKTDPVDKMFLGDIPHPEALVLNVNYDQNPFFPEVLRREMEYDRKHDVGKYEHVWLGKPVQHSEALVFSNRYRIDDSIQPVAGEYIYFGADFGFSTDPFAALRCWINDDEREIYIDHEVYGVGIEIDYLPAHLETIPGSKHYRITADSSRPDTISYLARQGYNIKGAIKGKGSVEDGIEFLKSYTLVVHPRCKHMLDELSLYSYKTDKRTGLILPELEDKDNHLIDALRYAVEKVSKNKGLEIFVG